MGGIGGFALIAFKFFSNSASTGFVASRLDASLLFGSSPCTCLRSGAMDRPSWNLRQRTSGVAIEVRREDHLPRRESPKLVPDHLMLLIARLRRRPGFCGHFSDRWRDCTLGSGSGRRRILGSLGIRSSGTSCIQPFRLFDVLVATFRWAASPLCADSSTILQCN